jgi:hypothetical protein
MGKDIRCPICGALNEKVILEETGNTFICDCCDSQIKVTRNGICKAINEK